MIDFPRWETWLQGKAQSLREQRYYSELRSGGLPTSKPCMSFRLETKASLGQFTAWITGEADYDIMDSETKEFTSHVWGLSLADATFEAAFEAFLSCVLGNDGSGGCQ